MLYFLASRRTLRVAAPRLRVLVGNETRVARYNQGRPNESHAPERGERISYDSISVMRRPLGSTLSHFATVDHGSRKWLGNPDGIDRTFILRLLIDQDLDQVILRGLLLRVPNLDAICELGQSLQILKYPSYQLNHITYLRRSSLPLRQTTPLE